MKCEEVTHDLLLDFSDWRLSPQDRNDVSIHLDECPACRVRKGEMEGMSKGLRDTIDAPPQEFLARLDPAFILEEEEKKRASRAPAPPPADGKPSPGPSGGTVRRKAEASRQLLISTLAAAAMIGLCIGIYFMLPPPGETPPPSPAVTEAPTPPSPAPVPEPAAKPKPVPVPPPEPAVAWSPVKSGPVPTRVALWTVRLPISHQLPPLPVPPPKPPPPPPPPPKALTGDLNGDGIVDIADARRIQRLLNAGDATPDHADVNGDGTVDAADVRHLTRAEIAPR